MKKCFSNYSRRGPNNLPYRNHISCGNKSCKVSCDENSLTCVICEKYFHYKCQKLRKRDYQNIINNNLDYICNQNCYSSILPFFECVSIDPDVSYPCRKCKLECMDGQDCIQCEICDSWLHVECANLKYDFSCYVQNLCGFICSEKCYTGELPFFSIPKFKKNDKFNPFKKFDPCKICQIDLCKRRCAM